MTERDQQTHVVTVEFTVNAEQAPDQSPEEAAVEAIRAALAEAKYAPNALIRSHLTNYVVRRVDA